MLRAHIFNRHLELISLYFSCRSHCADSTQRDPDEYGMASVRSLVQLCTPHTVPSVSQQLASLTSECTQPRYQGLFFPLRHRKGPGNEVGSVPSGY